MLSKQLVAHRGYPEKYPENTLIGYQAAADAGAHYIETDVMLTADRVPVLFHDRNMKRICNHDGLIHQYSINELARYKAMDFERFGYRYAQNPLTRLDELVTWLKKHLAITAFIEIKRSTIEHFGAEQTVSVILETLKPAARQCVVISYSMRALAMARRLGWQNIGAVVDEWEGYKHPSVQKLNPEFFFCDYTTLPRFGKLQIPGTRIAVYQTTSPETALKLFSRGIHLVETDAIMEMVNALNNCPG